MSSASFHTFPTLELKNKSYYKNLKNSTFPIIFDEFRVSNIS